MKKNYILSTVFAFLTLPVWAGDVVINETNFPDANFRNYLLEHFWEGVITEEGIGNVEELYLDSKEIASLKGIEFFTALTKLYCENNQLTSLDVSKNTALIRLSCNNNQLTSLDLSKNTALSDLHCENNQIKGTEMDRLVSSLPIKSDEGYFNLYVYGSEDDGNECTKAQVAVAKSRGWMPMYYDSYDGFVGWGEYYGCDLNYEGVTINRELFPDPRFRYYIMGQSYGKDRILTDEEILNISYLDISGREISSLQGIEYFTSLTYLSCSKNHLTSLDVSKNPALKYLDCDNNRLTSLDVSKNTALQSLNCYFNPLKSLDVSKNTALEGLYCYANSLTSLDVSKNTALSGLVCCWNQLTSLDVSKNTALTELDCDNNQLTSLDVSNNIELTSLDCHCNQLSSLDVSNNTTLTFLCCARNQIKGAEMDKLVNSLRIDHSEYKEFIVYSYLVSYLVGKEKEDGNVCTTEQVKVAKNRGWTPLCTEYTPSLFFDLGNYKSYEGSDPSGINGIVGDWDEDAPVYNLSGQRLSAPQKGINIVNGRKVLK